MNDKQKLMKQIQICDFVLLETALYLDTHKNCKEALAFYKKHLTMSEAYRKEYVENYGPLMVNESATETTWKWVDSKWPWEYDANVDRMGVK